MLYQMIGRQGIVPIYKGKGDRRECANYTGVSILNIPGKYGRVLINRVIESTKGSGGVRNRKYGWWYGGGSGS